MKVAHLIDLTLIVFVWFCDCIDPTKASVYLIKAAVSHLVDAVVSLLVLALLSDTEVLIGMGISIVMLLVTLLLSLRVSEVSPALVASQNIPSLVSLGFTFYFLVTSGEYDTLNTTLMIVIIINMIWTSLQTVLVGTAVEIGLQFSFTCGFCLSILGIPISLVTLPLLLAKKSSMFCISIETIHSACIHLGNHTPRSHGLVIATVALLVVFLLLNVIVCCGWLLEDRGDCMTLIRIGACLFGVVLLALSLSAFFVALKEVPDGMVGFLRNNYPLLPEFCPLDQMGFWRGSINCGSEDDVLYYGPAVGGYFFVADTLSLGFFTLSLLQLFSVLNPT